MGKKQGNARRLGLELRPYFGRLDFKGNLLSIDHLNIPVLLMGVKKLYLYLGCYRWPIYKNNISLNPHNTCFFTCMWVLLYQRNLRHGQTYIIITTYRPYIHKSSDRQSSQIHGRTKGYIKFTYLLAQLRLDFSQS